MINFIVFVHFKFTCRPFFKIHCVLVDDICKIAEILFVHFIGFDRLFLYSSLVRFESLFRSKYNLSPFESSSWMEGSSIISFSFPSYCNSKCSIFVSVQFFSNNFYLSIRIVEKLSYVVNIICHIHITINSCIISFNFK